MAPKKSTLQEHQPSSSSSDEQHSGSEETNDGENGEGSEQEQHSGSEEEDEKENTQKSQSSSESEETKDRENAEDSEQEDEQDQQSGSEGEDEEEENTQKSQSPSNSEESNDRESAEDSEQEQQSASEDEDDKGKKTQKLSSSSDSEEAIKPISPEKRRTLKKPSASDARPGAKRPAKEQSNVKDGQRKRMKLGTEEKKFPPKRLFSEDDEVAISKGVLDFKTKKGSDAFADAVGFHGFVKKHLSVNVSKNQLMDKARRLRKKYHTHVDKSVKGEEDPGFSKPFEHKCFQLWKKICGGDDSVSPEAVATTKKNARNTRSATAKMGTMEEDDDGSNATAKKKKPGEVSSSPEEHSMDEDEVHEEDFFSNFPQLKRSLENENRLLSMSESVMSSMKEMVPKIGHEGGKELEERWKNLRAEQTRLFLKELDLVREQTQLALDAMEAKDS